MNEKKSAFQPFPKISSPLSGDNQETLEHLQRAIELADGFALFFARCDQPAQRDDLIAHLDALFPRQGRRARRLDVVPPATGLLAGLKSACRTTPDQAPPTCVHICGLEDALSSDAPHPPVLSQLNLTRDRFRDLPCPLVFWLPDAVLTRLAQGAPDFWAWRSGTFDFLPQWVPLEERAEEQIRVLENLLADYHTLGDGPTEQRARASLLVDLAALYRDTYRPQVARQRLEEALPLVRRLRDTALESHAWDVLRALDTDLKTKDL